MELSVIAISLFATILSLLIFIYKREQQHQEERKDMLDRIMTRDFREFKEYTEPVQQYEPITMTEEEEYYREIEDNKNGL